MLFVVIYLIPLGLFYLAAGVAILTGESFHIDLGPLGLLLLPVFAIPVIHLFVSTSRMARSADRASPDQGGIGDDTQAHYGPQPPSDGD